MRALILAGGKGTRLRPLTVYTPKPVVPLINKPFLLYQIEILKRAGIKDITLSLNYQPDKIEHLLGFGKEFGVDLRYVTEPQPMGTGGAYKYAAGEFLETTIVLNGDILTDVILSKMIKHHQKADAKATIALTPVDEPSNYGLVLTDDDDRVKSFREKPSEDELRGSQDNLINAGIYILEPEILKLIPEGENFSFEYNVFPEILRRGMLFSAFVMRDAYWCDIGTPENYRQAHMDFLAGKVKHFPNDVKVEFEAATSSFVDSLSVIGDDCVIKPNATIINSVLGSGVIVDERAIIENSVIWSHCRISHSAEIHDSVLARSCYVGKNTVVGGGAVLGNKTSLTDYTKV